MKKSKVETAETHKRIVAVAAKAFKEKGIAATGVAEIMSAAGLTHGAYYRHFSSKRPWLPRPQRSALKRL